MSVGGRHMILIANCLVAVVAALAALWRFRRTCVDGDQAIARA